MRHAAVPELERGVLQPAGQRHGFPCSVDTASTGAYARVRLVSRMCEPDSGIALARPKMRGVPRAGTKVTTSSGGCVLTARKRRVELPRDGLARSRLAFPLAGSHERESAGRP